MKLLRAEHSLQPPGVVIAHRPATTQTYIGSPSVAILPDGTYVASHDEFGPGSTEHETGTTHIFASADRGRTWKQVSVLREMFWGGLFVHRGALYIIGTTRHHGHLVIRRSLDRGCTWSVPSDETSGLLGEGEFHTSSVPVIRHAGRIWRAVEDAGGGVNWGERYLPMVISASLNGDLLQRSNWQFSNALLHDRGWLEGRFGAWLEGNVVPTLDGQIANVLRVDFDPGEVAAAVKVSSDGSEISFDSSNDFFRFPGGATKFTIRYDPESYGYWALVNAVPGGVSGGKATLVRNTLALTYSSNLRDWTIRGTLLYHDDPLRHGFQYADWLFDGDDIIAAVRTAFDDEAGGSHSAHDANFLTFHRFPRFRSLPAEEK